MQGRATWYTHPHTGSCGYGKFQGIKGFNPLFDIDAVAALPDTHPDYEGSCGLCYEVKCRGIQAISADGSVNLPRQDACYNESNSIVVKVVDTCPCSGNEQWCCGDVDHLDLSKEAFGRLAEPGKGIIGLEYRAVPCFKKFRDLKDEDWKTFESVRNLGANPAVFKSGVIGQGWQKTIYSNERDTVNTYHPGLVDLDDGSKAICANLFQYGGFHFRSHKPNMETISRSTKVQFLAKSDGSNGLRDVSFMINNNNGVGCWSARSTLLKTKQAKRTVEVDGWTKFSFDVSSFTCDGVSLRDLNRIHFENLGPEKSSICVKDIELLL